MLELVTIHKNLIFNFSLFQLQVKTKGKTYLPRRLREICHSPDPRRNEEGRNSFLIGESHSLGVNTGSRGRRGTSGSILPSRLLSSSSLPLLPLSKQMTSWVKAEEAVGDHHLLLRQFPLGGEVEMGENVKNHI